MADNNILYTLEIKGLEENLKQLAELKQQIDENKKAIKESGDVGTKEAEARKIQLTQQQAAYKQLQNETKAQANAEENNIRTLAKMRTELARMNKELDNVEVGSERFKQLTVDSKKLRDEIKGADEATGRFQANVGNYKGAIIDAFQQMGIPVSSLNKGLNLLSPAMKTATGATGGLSTAMKILRVALISTGIGAVVVALGSLIAYLSTTQKGVDALNSVLKPLQQTLQRIVGIAQRFGEGMADVLSGNYADGFKKMGNAIKGAGDELRKGWQDGKRLADITKEIDAANLKLAENEGRITREMEEQRSILDNTNNSAEERRRAGEQYSKLNKELIDYKKRIADLTYEEARIKSEQNDTDRETQIELARLKEEQNALTAQGLAKEREVKNKLYALDKASNEEARRNAEELKKLNEEYTESRISGIEKYSEELIKSATETADALQVQADSEVQSLIDNNLIKEEATIEHNKKLLEARQQYNESQKTSFQKQYEDLKKLYDDDVITYNEYQQQKKKVDEDVLTSKLQTTSQAFSQLKNLTGKETALGKAAGIAEATINTYLAASKALATFPPPFGQVAAAAAIASGLKNVSQIIGVNTKFAHGVIGLQGAGSETSDSIDARLSKGESVMTAKATRVFAPVLADMERAVGNRPNVQIGSGRFANGLIQGNISDPRTNIYEGELSKSIATLLDGIKQIPVVVTESDITSAQEMVRKIKVSGDL